MNKEEALIMANLAMKFALRVGFDKSDENQIKKGFAAAQIHEAAIKACEKALAQPETKRDWVGLTNEEIDKIRNTLVLMPREDRAKFSIYTYARAIEAKLKEKNT
jgi:hypothetical protein